MRPLKELHGRWRHGRAALGYRCAISMELNNDRDYLPPAFYTTTFIWDGGDYLGEYTS